MIKRFYRTLLFANTLTLSSLIATGQAVTSRSSELEFLHLKLKTAKSDTAKSAAMLKLGNYYEQGHQGPTTRDSGLYYFKQSYIQATKAGTSGLHLKLESLCRTAETLYADDSSQSDRPYFLEAVSLAHTMGNREKEAWTWFRMAAISDFENKVICYQKAIDLFHILKEDEREAFARTRLATHYLLNAKFNISEKIAHSIIGDYQTRFPNLVASSYYILSVSNRYKGNLNIALLNTLKGIQIHKDLGGDLYSASLLYGELGLVYQEMGDSKKSIYWYRKTVEVRERQASQQPVFIIRTVGFIVQQLISEGKLNEALNEILSLEKRKNYQKNFDRALVAQIKGECYDALTKPALAEHYFLTALSIYDFKNYIPQEEVTQILYYDVAKFYISQHRYLVAEKYLKKLVPAYSMKFRMDIELLKFKQDSAMHNNLSAIEHYQVYKAYSDSIFNIAKSKQFEELEIIYRTKEREKDFALLQKSESLQHERIASSEKEKKLTLAGVALLIILIALLFNGYRVKRKSNNEISLKNTTLNQLVEDKDKLIEEKQWLLKEIHHRVKNNLQIVIGLLQRQSAFINNKEALAAFQNSENRMHSIALIHQKLYQSQDISSIFMPEYIDELITNLTESIELNNRLKFETSVDGIYLDVSQAVPLGLILNEGITNAIKYAYPDNQMGSISVSLLKTGNEIMLTVADQGIGLPLGFNTKKATSLGLTLIEGLTKQLSGKLTLKNENGLTITIIFKPTL